MARSPIEPFDTCQRRIVPPHRDRLAILVMAALLPVASWLRPATAQVLGPEFQVNTYTTGDQLAPAVAADGRGNLVVVWDSYYQDGSNFGVFARRMWISIFSDGCESGDGCAWSVVVGGGGCS